MALRGVSMSETEEVILLSDPAHPDNLKGKTPEQIAEAGAPTVFIIGPLTVDDRIEIGDIDSTLVQAADGMKMTLRNTERAYITVRRALKGWRNLLDKNNNNIGFVTATSMVGGFPRVVASPDSLAAIDRESLLQLSRIVSEKNGLRTELEKKLETLSAPQVAVVSETGDALTKDVPPNSGGGEGAESPAS